ncbi:ABC transporter substrate-binding protein [Subtercola sp. RTI3]|uniref:ABC transporter substrate-binding protein n=1 Tax=Subtercola sp. RTI3 TaxID=3048639 RepID=UPI002B23BD3A|nr:ABC transporter substrate-binding protein [Subtercola sp. RTI3]MEA9986060.1 ABC transporter substrate-binding protein [Subtercola sp. RTI3]
MDRLLDTVKGHQLSRRNVIFGAALGVIVPTLLAGCSTGGGGATTNAIGAPRTGTAAKGGILRIARPPASKAETLDPASSLSAYEYLGALYNRLVKLSTSGSLLPDLAASWQQTPDAMTWTFTLRSDVSWHDGKPFTSADVVYTMQHILDPATASPQAGVLSPFLTGSSISAPTATTVVFALSSPNAEFASLLAGYNCYIIPAGSAATIGASGIGTGPFSLTSFTAAGPGAVARNESYFGDKPMLDSIEFSSIADTQARVNALLAGQVDFIAQTNLDFASAKLVTASTTVTVSTIKNAQWYPVPMLNSSAEFSNPLVRQALAHAYNPTEVLQLSVQNYGTVAKNNPVPPTEAYYLDYGLDYDPDKSKSLLKQAGMDSFTSDIYTSTYDPVLTPLALALKGSMAPSNITLNVVNASADSYYTDVWMKKPLMTTYWYTGRPIDQLLNQIFRSGSSYNETAYSNPTFDQTLDAARATVDDAKRKTLYQDAQKILIDDGGSLTPFFSDRLVGLSKKIVNYDEHGFEFDYLKIGFEAV